MPLYDFANIWNVFDYNLWNYEKQLAKNENDIKQLKIFCPKNYVNFTLYCHYFKREQAKINKLIMINEMLLYLMMAFVICHSTILKTKVWKRSDDRIRGKSKTQGAHGIQTKAQIQNITCKNIKYYR